MGPGDVVRVVYPANYRKTSYLGHMSDYVPEGTVGVIENQTGGFNRIKFHKVKFFTCPDELFYVEDKWLEIVT